MYPRSPYHHPAVRHSPAPGMRPSFIRSVEDVGGVRILRLEGPVGMQIGRKERDAEEASEAAAGAFLRPLLLDFEATTEWDSSTVASLVLALRRRLAARTKVAIINAPPKLVAELEISRLRALFPIYSSQEAALDALMHSTNCSGAIP